MAKRLTDTDKWKKKWYRTLCNDHKIFWQYLLDHCNHAGIWDVDFEFAEMFCGPLVQSEIRRIFEKQFMELDGGKRWFIKDFIDFQYGELNPNNNLHRSVISLLRKSGALEGLKSPSLGAKNKDKNKNKEKDKEKEKIGGCGGKEKFFDYVYLTPPEHEELIKKIGAAQTADFIERLNNYLGSTGKKYKSHYHTILVWSKGNSNGKSNEHKQNVGTDAQRDRAAALDSLAKQC